MGYYRLERTELLNKCSANNSLIYPCGLFAILSHTAINYIMEEVEAILCEGPLTTFTRIAGCGPRENCYQRLYETILWDHPEFQRDCQYDYDRTYTPRVSRNEAFIRNTQAAPTLLNRNLLSNNRRIKHPVMLRMMSSSYRSPLRRTLRIGVMKYTKRDLR